MNAIKNQNDIVCDQLNRFILDNGLKLVVIETPNLVINGYIGTKVEINYIKTLDLTDCTLYFKNGETKTVAVYSLKMSEVISWGLLT